MRAEQRGRGQEGGESECHKISNGHGDPKAANVYPLLDGSGIIDSLLFHDRARSVNVIGELAYPGMDLDRFGLSKAADEPTASFSNYSKILDPYALSDHIRAYDAYV